jgi:transposase
VRQQILDLKAEHPAFTPHEIASICQIRFDHRPRPHTIKRILADTLPILRTTRRFLRYHEIADSAERRLVVIRLHSEGWAVKSIAAYLETGRETVYRTLRRWVVEGVAGLEDKSHASTGVRKVDLKAIATVKELQENPRRGEFRVHARLRQLGIFLSPQTRGRILAHNRAVYGLTGAVKSPGAPKPFPFAAQYRHECWTVDLRYIDNDHVGELGLTDRAEFIGPIGAIHCDALDEDGRDDVIAAVHICKQVIEEIARAEAWSVPQVVMRIDDRQIGFEDLLIPAVEPVLAHGQNHARRARFGGARDAHGKAFQ